MNNTNENIGKLLLRLTLGGLILLHGIAKLTGGVSGISGMLASSGLPPLLAYGAYVGEVIAPIMLILGWYSRVGAAFIAINMLFAIGLAHRDELFTLGNSGGWALELQGMFLLTAIALTLIGPGRLSMNGK